MRYVLRRAGFFLLTLWAAVTLNFFIPRAVPGNPVQTILSKYPDLTPEAYKALSQMIDAKRGIDADVAANLDRKSFS